MLSCAFRTLTSEAIGVHHFGAWFHHFGAMYGACTDRFTLQAAKQLGLTGWHRLCCKKNGATAHHLFPSTTALKSRFLASG